MDEVTDPVLDFATDRVAVLAALPAPTKAEKAELKLLSALVKGIGKTAKNLAGDFKELKSAAAAHDKAGVAAVRVKPSLDLAYARASLSLSERTELVQDYAAVLTDPKHKSAVLKALTAVTSARSAAASAVSEKKRAAALASADAAVTAALKKADKFVLGDFDVTRVPPTRYRSGDTLPTTGGRVAIPRDAASAAAGASLVVPNGVMPAPAAFTIEAATGFVGGVDVPAGPAVAVGPAETTFAADVTLFVPYQLPGDAVADDLALLAKGPPLAEINPVTPGADGLMSAALRALGTFQAAIPAPPPGQPGGTYHLQMFFVNTALDTGGQDVGGVLAGFIDRSAIFRKDHTGTFTTPVLPSFSRTFTGAAPHHTDVASSPFDGSVDTAWTSTGAGTFTVQFTLAGRDTTADGVVSTDGRVLALSGRGTGFEYFAVGVRGQDDAAVGDLAGRWAAVETGVEFQGGTAEPFTTKWIGNFRAFTADGAGAVTFAPAGAKAETWITYHTDETDAPHTRVAPETTDGGTETWTVAATGRVAGAQNGRAGWLDAGAGVLSLASYDANAKRVSFLVAVRQADALNASAIPGAFHAAGLDVGATAGVLAAHASTHDVTPWTGTFTVADTANASLAVAAATRSTYSLAGPPPTADIAWTLSAASESLGAATAPWALSLDAAGNDVTPGAERWLAFSTDGGVALFLTRGEAVRQARGIGVGLK